MILQSAWMTPAGYVAYAYAEILEPFTRVGVWGTFKCIFGV